MGIYTHKFWFETNDKKVTGNIEFNVDGTSSHETNEAIPNMSTAQFEVFGNFLKMAKRIFDEFGSVKKIEVEAD